MYFRVSKHIFLRNYDSFQRPTKEQSEITIEHWKDFMNFLLLSYKRLYAYQVSAF